MPKVSIIILTYNSRLHLEDLFSSIKKQSFTDYEVIVVDNNSSDDTVNFIKNNYSDVKLIINSDNYWFSKGNNIGIRQASGEYVLISNDDIKLHENFLEILINSMDQDSKIGAICGKTLKLTDDKNYSILDGVGIKTNIFRRFSNIGENQPDKGQFDAKKQVFGVSGALALYRKTALEQVKYKDQYFDEDFIAYKEDIDLSYRLRAKNWKILYEPKAIAWHKRSIQKSSLKDRQQKNKLIKALSYRNHWWVLIKNEPVSKLILLAPFILSYELLKFIYILFFEFYSLKFCLQSLKKIK